MVERLKDKVAVVTGAGRGVGRAEALALAAEGAKVVVNDLGGAPDGSGASAEPADEVVAEIKKAGGTAAASHHSVATLEGAESIIKTALDNFGRLDILVNNAGITKDRMIFNMTDEEWDTIMKVHLYGHFYCTRAACRIFRQQNSGRIINTSSEVGAVGNTGQANYTAAKEGIVGFTKTVALDMGKYGVTCNCIRPRAATRLTLTDQLKAAVEAARDRTDPASIAFVEGYTKEVLPNKPEAIAPLVVYLASDEAANVNGCVFCVRGGLISLHSNPVEVKTLYTEDMWTVDRLADIFPLTLGKDLVNPAAPSK
jgi:NAD(P)-dependent dehydrogenase (short-subunit alcohol dehydrogenase family)